jgi:pimeloyl-ACP methyl ester carboxylesterase
MLPGCAWLSAKQSELALRPTPGRPAGLPPDAQLFRPQDERFTLPQTTPGKSVPDQVAMWWLPHADPQAPTLLYLHGTFFNLYRNLPKINALRDAGFAILAVDYRGWGDSTPIVPTEATINADARLAWAELQRRQPVPAQRVIFGHSMGTAVAVTLASSLRHGDDYAALVLEAAFTRMPDIAAEAGFLGRVAAALTTLDFNSLAKIGRVDAPILMLHGDADRTVPIVLGRRLRDAAKPGVRWVEVPAGSHSRLHSDAPDVYQRSFKDLIESLRPKP